MITEVAGTLKDRSTWAAACLHRKKNMLRRSHFDQVPPKPQRVYEEMNAIVDRDTRATSRRSDCRRSPARSFCTCIIRAIGSIAVRPVRWAGRCLPRWACARPIRRKRSWRSRVITISNS
jgi:hypothetical protein